MEDRWVEQFEALIQFDTGHERIMVGDFGIYGFFDKFREKQKGFGNPPRRIYAHSMNPCEDILNYSNPYKGFLKFHI